MCWELMKHNKALEGFLRGQGIQLGLDNIHVSNFISSFIENKKSEGHNSKLL